MDKFLNSQYTLIIDKAKTGERMDIIKNVEEIGMKMLKIRDILDNEFLNGLK